MFPNLKVSMWAALPLMLVAQVFFFTGCGAIRSAKPPVYMPEAKQTPAEPKKETSGPPQTTAPKPAPVEKPVPPAKPLPEAGKQPPAVPEAPTAEPAPPTTPRALAALNLVDRGRALIDEKKPDEAIRILERAVQVHPGEGKGYYYLAEAWLMKGNRDQAAEFNRLAGLYLRNSPMWSRSVEDQRQRIDRH